MKNLVLILGMSELGKKENVYNIHDTLPCLKTSKDNEAVFNSGLTSEKKLSLKWFDYIDLGEVLRNTDDNWVLEHLATLTSAQKVINTL